ncbi:RidA family protein [Salinicola salarius]|uniref:RidA family protein n=1 Tax=Salinicola salarius TaxID=430457 RepID=UPI0023E3C5EC|nr:RidA family protein [Salinicola salarius]MDF3919154.1 RidA family protein [Salinicola salarius]
MSDIKRHIQTPIMHRVVEANGFLFLGGIVAEDRSQDMAGQTRQILERIDAYLAEAGSNKSKIVAATLYATDLGQKEAMNDVWKAWLDPAMLPARATLGVSDLAPGALLEVVVTAVK